MPNASVFPLFHQLSSVKPEDRLAGVTDLISLLQQDGKEEELQYSTTRLVRGLTSSRAAARQGFALGLCSLLRDNIITDLDKVFIKLQEETATAGLKGEEERDRLLGRVFGLLALVRSDKLSAELKLQTAKSLCELTKEKTWFKDLCTFALCLLIESSSEDEILVKIGDLAVKKMEPDSLDLSAVQILLLRKQNLPVNSALEQINRKKLAWATAIHHERLGMVWEQILLCATESSAAEAEKIWKDLCEPTLLRGGNIPRERKLLAWRLFARIASKQPLAVPNILTKALLSSCLGLKPQPDYAYACIVKACEQEPSIRERVVATLLEFGDFDGKTRSKTVASLVGGGAQDASGLISRLAEQYSTAAADDETKQQIVDSLFDLGKINAGNCKLLLQVLEFFHLNGLNGEQQVTKPSALCRRRFFSLVTRAKPEDFLSVLRKFAAATVEFSDDKLGRTYETLILYLTLLQRDEEEQVLGADQLLEDLSQAVQDGDDVDLPAMSDMLLALSAQPNAMLRDLVKQLTRCLSFRLAESQPAIEVLMSVLVVAKKGKNEEDEEEEHEEVEEDASSSSSSSDSESEEEEEEKEITGEDEEEMEAYDRALEEMLKSRIQKKSKTSDKDQATTQAVVFKLRVLDLLEIILTKTGPASLLESLPKFLQLVEDSAQQQPAPGDKKKKLLVEPSNALFNRLQSIVKKLFAANNVAVGDLQCTKQVLEIASGMLKKTKQEALVKVGADALCFLASTAGDSDALDVVSTQLLPLFLVGHVNCKLLFTSLSLLADKTPQVEQLVEKLVAVQPRTQFQGELQLELLFKLLKRKSTLSKDMLLPVFSQDGEMSVKRIRLLLRCLQVYVKSHPNQVSATQIDSICKLQFAKTNSPPVKQLCLELVSDRALLVGAEEQPAKKKARMSLEERKEKTEKVRSAPSTPAAAATPNAKKQKTDKQQQKKKD